MTLLVDFTRREGRRRQHASAPCSTAGRMLSIRFFMWLFSSCFVSVLVCPAPPFLLVFSVSEPEAQRGDRRRRGKGDDGHQHIAARVLPQQHRAEHCPTRRSVPALQVRPPPASSAAHSSRHESGEAYCLAPLPPAGVFPHPLLDECDPLLRYRTYRLNPLSGLSETVA